MSEQSDQRLTLSCFPYAGGDGSLFASWEPALEGRTAVLPLRVDSPRAGETLKERAERLLEEHEARCCTARFAFFGHSLGALTAFEATRLLARKGRPLPDKLFLSAFPMLESEWQGELAEPGFSDLVQRAGTVPAELLDDEFFVEILREASRDLELLAGYRYVPDDPLPIPLVVLGGIEDPLVPPSALEGWNRQGSAGCGTHLFSGGHMFIETAADEVLDLIRKQLGLSAVDA